MIPYIFVLVYICSAAIHRYTAAKSPCTRGFRCDIYTDLLSTKKTAYADLKRIRDELRELSVHKANYEELRDLEEREERKEKERGRE